ncbi:FtsX-like permease family protein [Agilicoccus flavus]|uniref:FtsX-like permease family protein n=1 Tax=Agilicoccus flavus TaxID=2775968 RepID=UPI001CF69AA6|nr:FtsX-like permease family protein [Agilicoccus flavus]
MRAALGLWWGLQRREAAHDRRPTLLAVLAFAVSTTALLVSLGGTHAFVDRAAVAPPGDEYAPIYVVLALVACALLVVPILTLGGVAARLGVARRHARLATLRLAGATSRQVGLMTLAECAAQAFAGAILGALGYALALAPLSLLAFQGRRLGVDELWLGLPLVAAVVAGVVLLSVASGVGGLLRVVVGPLGVAARTTPVRLSAVRVLVVGCVVLAWFVVGQLTQQVGMAVTLGVLAAVVATINVLGPYVVMLSGLAVARLARGPETLLAARRIVDDPRSTWRSVSALGLGVALAALSSVGTVIAGDAGADPAGAVLGADIATGSLVALVIVSVVAATSTGVVQAARVIDQGPQYRALALAGAPIPFLHRARLREVTIPLGATIVLGSVLPLLVLVPFADLAGIGLLVRTVVAIAAAAALTVAALAASRPLVREAVRL